MKKHFSFQILFSFFLFAQFGFAQIDVVYNDLVWSDEFDTTGPVSGSKWFLQTKIPVGGSWFNGEVQHYTNRQANAFVNSGNLNIVAKKETFTDQNVTKQYTSARLNSKFAFKYGRVDIRAKAPNGQGTWPALWLMGKNLNEDGAFFDAQFGTTNWPACGELDIMEHGIFPGEPINYIGSAIHTPSSFANTINKGGIQAGDIEQNYHVYTMNWSPNQITFLLDGIAYYTYNPAVKDASTWPFDKEQFLLFNIAMGGMAGAISANFTQTSMVVDYVRIYQNVVADTQDPTNFTATFGTVTGTTAEILATGTDNSGTVSYSVSGGPNVTTASGLSNVQKSIIVSGLTPNTSYTFQVSASDLSGNIFANNPVTLSTTTPATFICEGQDVTAIEGSFVLGYKHKFETLGTDVKITFELLDNRPEVIAYLWRENPFSEALMTLVTGRTFTRTITGQTPGATIKYAAKFAWAGGGVGVTKYVPYVVGSNCAVGVEPLSISTESVYPNPIENILNLQLLGENKLISLTDVTGRIVMDEMPNTSQTLDMRSFKPGIYFLKVKSTGGTRNIKILKK